MPVEGKTFVDTQCVLVDGVFHCIHCNGIVIPILDDKYEHQEDKYRYPCSCKKAHQAAQKQPDSTKE